jgi:hypothetical protein
VRHLSIETRHSETETRQHHSFREAREWRRSQVLELSSGGYSIMEIAQNLQKHIHEVVPEEYQKMYDRNETKS